MGEGVAMAVAASIAGCGLSTVGLAPVDAAGAGEGGAGVGEADASPTRDGSVAGDGGGPSLGGDAGGGLTPDAKSDAPSSGDGGATTPCVSALPAGWGVVAYEAARAACPAGYGGHDAYSGAAAAAGACACDCQITTSPNCTKGMVATSYGGGGGTCPMQGEVLTVDGSSCTALTQSGNLTQYFASQPVALSGGACSGTATGDPSQVTKQGVRYCDVPPASAESVCEGMAPASFAACIVSAGDVGCPTGSPFTNKTLVADDEMLTCSACTTCAVSGTCNSPKIAFFSDGACTQQVVQLASDGTCEPSNANNQPVAAAEYSAQTNATCQASGTAASVSPQGPHTLCCR